MGIEHEPIGSYLVQFDSENQTFEGGGVGSQILWKRIEKELIT